MGVKFQSNQPFDERTKSGIRASRGGSDELVGKEMKSLE